MNTEKPIHGKLCPPLLLDTGRTRMSLKLSRGHWRGHGHNEKLNCGHGRGYGHENIICPGHGRGHEIIWNGGHRHKIFENSRARTRRGQSADTHVHQTLVTMYTSENQRSMNRRSATKTRVTSKRIVRWVSFVLITILLFIEFEGAQIDFFSVD